MCRPWHLTFHTRAHPALQKDFVGSDNRQRPLTPASGRSCWKRMTSQNYALRRESQLDPRSHVTTLLLSLQKILLMICPVDQAPLPTLIAANLSRAIVVVIMLDIQTRALQGAKEMSIENWAGYRRFRERWGGNHNCKACASVMCERNTVWNKLVQIVAVRDCQLRQQRFSLTCFSLNTGGNVNVLNEVYLAT